MISTASAPTSAEVCRKPRNSRPIYLALKDGLYDFDADQNTIRTFKGKAEVLVNNKKIGLGRERQLELNTNSNPQAHDFDARKAGAATFASPRVAKNPLGPKAREIPCAQQ